MLANFSRKLRQELAQAKSQAAELEVAAVQQEVDGLQQLLQQQQDFAHTLAQVCQVAHSFSCAFWHSLLQASGEKHLVLTPVSGQCLPSIGRNADSVLL